MYYGSFVHPVNATLLEHVTNGVIAVDKSGKIVQVENNVNENQARQIASKHGISLFPLGNQKFLIPGLIDTHIHAPQYVFTGSGMDLQLLDWLNTFTFPREARFNNTNYAKDAYGKVVDRVIRSGTTAASYYATIHLDASKALTDIVEARGQRAFVGKVNMDRNSPDYLIETTAQSLKDTEAFIQYVLGKKNSRVTPISHLDENLDEIAWVKELHPDQPDYTSVYDSHGLLTNRSIMAHVVYPIAEEARCRGVAKIRQMMTEGQKVGLGTDVSGGYSPSILNNIRHGYFSAIARSFDHPEDKYLQLAEVFYLGGADVIGMKSTLGNFMVGKQFGALIIDPIARGSPIDLFDHGDIKTTFEKFINNGDDRNIVQVFVDGKTIHRI
ncbi:nedasin s-form [Basidiobolus meristosporus CBS 931.73]|uniref:Nedasin s-form n=1 Tax=Basidiobolus meristosporus CBS 931.73 TaxID=1314790 RepID=A0A1Y1YRB4_9FUNG|nr:nedasin s-form [Basidiobolus meristosporus CBS 931.73]|eukprot:ORY00287.1 nedasin s-form [Basidiobolus meristosporus CBS 931.73]